LIPAIISNLFVYIGPRSFVIVQLFVIGTSFVLFLVLIIFFRRKNFENQTKDLEEPKENTEEKMDEYFIQQEEETNQQEELENI
jgi:hypothetical protein